MKNHRGRGGMRGGRRGKGRGRGGRLGGGKVGDDDGEGYGDEMEVRFIVIFIFKGKEVTLIDLLYIFTQYGDDDYENMGDEDYDDFSKELNQYKKSKDRGRGKLQ